MAVRQYIGARYVPTYYRNSQDPTSSEWEPNVQYDPLTIVSLPNLHSYQSKKFVPANIGSPALNPEYWYDQGYANAYFQALQDQIDDMKDSDVPGSLQNQIDSNASDITALKNDVDKMPVYKKYILIGDSFAYGMKGDGTPWVGGWIDLMATLLPNSTYFFHPSSDSFAGTAAFLGTNPFYDLFDWVVANKLTDVDLNTITDVIVLGGNNEPANQLSSVKTAVSTFINHVKTVCPNAKISIGCLGLDANLLVSKAYPAYKEACNENGALFLDDLLNLGTDQTYDSGHGHWSDSGYAKYNPYVVQCVLFGRVSYHWNVTIPLTLGSDVAVAGTPTFVLGMDVTEKGTTISVYTTSGYAGWVLVNDSGDGVGSIDIVAFESTLPIYNKMTSGTQIGEVIMFNNVTINGICHGILAIQKNGSTWQIRIKGFIQVSISNSAQLSFSFAGGLPIFITN